MSFPCKNVYRTDSVSGAPRQERLKKEDFQTKAYMYVDSIIENLQSICLKKERETFKRIGY